MRVPCIKCKGRNPANCGRTFCPIVAKSEALFKVKDKINKEDFSGSSPAPFVGRFGYPNINVGILSPPEQKDDAWLHDAPNHWSKEEFKIPQIVDLRSSLINSRFKAYVKERSDRLLCITQEVGMASKPVDIEVNPNTVVRTYGYLEDKGIIFKQRGIGYFVAEGGFDKVLNLKKEVFLQQEVPKFFKTMELLNLKLGDIKPSP